MSHEPQYELHFARDTCAAHGRCAMINPEFFVQDADGFLDLPPVTPLPPEVLDDARAAENACPMLALRVTPAR
ncbi:MAG: ferredoxin [Actinomycetales bacterium]|nr:ferredoxin [Actinomycetales bacterium]